MIDVDAESDEEQVSQAASGGMEVEDVSDDEEEDGDEDEDAASNEGVDYRRSGRRRMKRTQMNIPHGHARRGQQSYDVQDVHGTIHLQREGGLAQMTEAERDQWVLGVILTQYSLNKGLKKFGVKGEESVVKELTQHHDLTTFTPMDPSKLTRKQRVEAVSSLLFLTEKRDGKLKSRMCADGSKQRTYEGYDKNDTASPTAATESVLITGVIDAKEKRKVATIDLPGAFLHALNDEEMRDFFPN